MDKLYSLTPAARAISVDKATQRPFTGEYLDKPKQAGTYLCRRCGLALFRADNQFTSSCGWPSFDDELPGAIAREVDADGRRTEILCQRCGGHLGHAFQGEAYTAKNLRHCVNSLAIEFVADNKVLDTEEAILAAGCFWGVQYYLERLPGVLKTEVGYTGGAIAHPTYEQVCGKKTGHLEAIRVVYDRSRLSYEDLIKYFFEIHDFTQVNGQGPDLGPQYLSGIFYFNEVQKKTAESIVQQLQKSGYTLATQLKPVSMFWPAEDDHQAYYEKTGKTPYCHTYTKRFFLSV